MTGVVILAGGRGARMGGNKPFHPWGDATLIEATLARLEPQAENIAINAGALDAPHATRLAGLGLPVLYDDLPWRGPLSGVLSALQWAQLGGETYVITCPCDMPELPDDYVVRLMTAPDAAIVHYGGADNYPLCARWRADLAPALVTALKAAPGGLRVRNFSLPHSPLIIPVVDPTAFANINQA
ncbi:MAG TPA: molybdenum cofactor guanylyltransferase [Asticcacaulis sp.]|nr:molybdenum cofactor guanylyltransferase [Asticcacaulis sp.]